MVEAILRLARERHRNVYVPLCVVRADLPPGKKGGEEDIVGVLGLSVDFDDGDAANWQNRLPMPPDLVIESSAGRFQAFYAFDAPVTLNEGKPIGRRLRDFCHSDHGSLDLSHVWRVPGTLNWPNAKKLAQGRPPEPQLARLALPWMQSRTGLAGLDQALPELELGAEGDAAVTATGAALDDAVVDANSGYLPPDLEAIWGMLPEKLKARIREPEPQGGDRSKTLFYVIRALAKRGLKADMIERLIRHHPNGGGAKYADRRDLTKEIARILAKQTRRDAYREEAAAARGSKPVVQLLAGKLMENVDESETILIANDKELYQRGDFIVRPGSVVIKTAYNRRIEVPGMVQVKLNTLIERFTKVVDFQTFSARSEEWSSVNCPPYLAQTYLERVRHWRLPYLTAIVTAPFLRSDGSILQTPGYDAETGILYQPLEEFPPIPEFPSEEDALVALAGLKSLIAEFPFVASPRTPEDEGDLATGRVTEAELDERSANRSVALSFILTALIRAGLPTAPLHAFSAPMAGTGKSKLVEITSMIASGHEPAVISPGQTEEEMEKRLGAELINGSTVICFDNTVQCLQGVLLAQALTQIMVRIRILGHSEMVTVVNTALFGATGNNLKLAADIPRRAIRCEIDAKCERPELRQFRNSEDPVQRARRERARFVVAGLTVLRAYHLVRDRPLARPLGNFEDWSLRVRDALIWAGEPDPCLTMGNIRDEDPELAAHAGVIAQWEIVLGDRKDFSVKMIIERACGAEGGGTALPGIEPNAGAAELREALLVVAGKNGAINSVRLGRWLGEHKGRIVNGRQIVPTSIIHGFQHWQLLRVSETPLVALRPAKLAFPPVSAVR
jgi:hypothetical protein